VAHCILIDKLHAEGAKAFKIPCGKSYEFILTKHGYILGYFITLKKNLPERILKRASGVDRPERGQVPTQN
jgi:hypothetical protein